MTTAVSPLPRRPFRRHRRPQFGPRDWARILKSRRFLPIGAEGLEDRRLLTVSETLGVLQLQSESFQQSGTQFSTTGTVQVGFAPASGETFVPLIQIAGDGTENTVSFDESSSDPSFNVSGTIGAIISGTDITLWSGSTSLNVSALTSGQIGLSVGESFSVAGVSFALTSIGLDDPAGAGTDDSIIQLQGSLSVPSLAGLEIEVDGGNYVEIDQSGVSLTGVSATISQPFQVFGLAVTPTDLSVSYASAGDVFSVSGGVTISAGAPSLPGYVSFGGNFGIDGLVISNGSLASFDVSVATDVDVDGMSLETDHLDLVYDEVQDLFAIDGGAVTLTAKTGGAGLTFSGTFAEKDGLVINDGSLQDLSISISDNIDLDGATLVTNGLVLVYNKDQDLFAIDGGSVTISAGTGEAGITVSGAFAAENGLVIKDGSLQALDVTISGDISADGTSLKADGVGISFDPARDQIEIVSGTVTFDFGTDVTNSISGTFGSTANGQEIPGLVIRGGQLESIDITINSQITVASLAIDVTNLDFQYNRSDHTFELSGSVSVAVGGGSPITATLVSPGLVISNSTIQSVNLALTGGLDLFDLELDFQSLTVTYAAATQNAPAEYTVTGGITIPELFDASVTLGSDGQDGLTIVGGQWDIGGFTISVADIPLGAFTLEDLEVSYAAGGTFSVAVTVIFPEGWAVGGCISFVGSKLDELSLSFSAGDGEGIEIGDTGLFINWIAATVQNIDEPANLIVSGAIGVDFGGSVSLGGQTVTIFSATGSFTVDRDGMTLDAGIAVAALTQEAPPAAACPIVGTPQPPPVPDGLDGEGTATISLDWSTKVYQVSAQFSMYDDVFSFSTTFTFRDLGGGHLAFSLSAKADVNVPKGIPFIGGKTLGHLDFLFVYDSQDFQNTGGAGGFVAAWVELDIIHKFDIGIKYDFSDAHRSFKVIGTSAVNALNQEASSPAPQVYTYQYQFTVPAGATIAVAGLDWQVVDPTATLQITFPNGAVVSPGNGIPNGAGNTAFVSTAAALATPTSSVLQLVGSTTDETVALPNDQNGDAIYTLTLTSHTNYTAWPVFTATYHYYQPTIAITNLSTPDPSQPNQVQITLDASVDSAFAGATTISLFAVPQALGGSGAPIDGQSVIAFTGTGQGLTATWDMSGLFPVPYQVYARIDDTFNVPILTPLSAATETPVFPINGVITDPDNNQGIPGVTVFLDANGNGQYDPGDDPATTTGTTGFYAFTPAQVSNGQGKVGIVIPHGFATAQDLIPYNYTGTPLAIDFSLAELASISGTVYEDLNLNQQPDAGEPTVGGITIGLDTNGNGRYDTGEPMAVTNNSGQYTFYDVSPGTTPYSVVLLLAQGVDFSTGDVTLLTNPILDPFQQETGLNFYILPYATVSGTIVGSVVTNSQLQQPNTNLAGWIVRLTYDNDGNSIQTNTNSDGTYTFTGVLPGQYQISVFPPSGWQQTSPVTQVPSFNQNSTYYPSSATPAGLTVADFNNDGLLDFAAGDDYSTGDSTSIDIYMNNINGVFTPRFDVVQTTFDEVGGLVAADIDGDGTADVVALDMYGLPEWLQNDGAGNFSLQFPWSGVGFGLGVPYSAVRMGPLNEATTGADSIAFTYYNNTGTDQVSGIAILTGAPSYSASRIPIEFSSVHAKTAYGLASGDVNGDGFLDLVTSDANDLYVAIGDGQGDFALQTIPISSFSSTSYTLGGAIGVGDFNGDGRPDLAIATTQAPYSVVILLNQGALNWSVGPVLTVNSSSDSPQTEIASLIVADFNGDMLPDIAVTPYQTNLETTSFVDIFFQNPSTQGGFTLFPGIRANTTENAIVAADLNNDGLPDFISGGFTVGAGGTEGIAIVANNSQLLAQSISIAISPGDQAVSGRDFAFVQLGQLNGSVYDDANRNGRRDAGESGQAGQTVYLDLNHDGAYEPGIDRATTTIDGGYYAFNGLPTGRYVVRIVPSGDHKVSTPEGESYDATVTAGSRVTSLDFGQVTALISPLTRYVIAAGTPFSVTATTTALAGVGPLAYRLGAGAPVGISIDRATGLITWTPTFDQAGRTYVLTVLASDPFDPTRRDSTTLTIVVQSLPGPIAYVRSLYEYLFGKPASDSTAKALAGELASGLSRSDLVGQLWASPAHRAVEVDQAYQTYLGRVATPEELSRGTQQLNQGLSQVRLAAQLLGSRDFRLSHPTKRAFLNGLYLAVLGRTPTRLETLTRFHMGNSARAHTAFALRFFNSPKVEIQLIDRVYRQALGRGPTASETLTWVGALRSHRATIDSFTKTILASEDFYSHAQGG